MEQMLALAEGPYSVSVFEQIQANETPVKAMMSEGVPECDDVKIGNFFEGQALEVKEGTADLE